MQRLTDFFTNLMRKYLPDPFVFAIGLTWLTLLLSIVVERSNPLNLLDAWGKGFWSLLAFSMQMTVILAAGAVLATTPVVDRLLDTIVARVHTPRAAIVVATLVGGIGSYLNWGFGLIIGGVMAKKLALKVRGVHHPLIIAAAYSGFSLWGFGLSATIPLTISTPGHPLADKMGIVPLTRTIFSPWMLGLAALILLVLCVVNAMMHPTDPAKVVEIDRAVHGAQVTRQERHDGEEHELTVSSRLNNSRILGISIGLFGLAYVVQYFVRGGKLDINIVNLLILFLGLTLLKTPAAYAAKLQENIGTVSGIVLQFPFYAGIMALMGASGLVETISNGFVAVADKQTLPFWGLISSFVINFFAPSGGGHWVIQGPFMVEAAHRLGADMGQTAMSVQLGNVWNDLVQPFWVLPALALSKLKLKDIMGYSVMCMMATGVVHIAVTLLWGYLG